MLRDFGAADATLVITGALLRISAFAVAAECA
jgi:hypothetical protein